MPQIKIASWNVNSINARLENLLFWLNDAKPDVALLQEIKCEEENFPHEPIANLGYNIAISGQKSYNGVAILSKLPLQDVVKKFQPNKENLNIGHKLESAQNQQGLPIINQQNTIPQARYIEAVVCFHNQAIRVASIYVPNGGAELLPNQKVNESEKFAYKMRFFEDLTKHLKDLLKNNEIAVFGGDYNVAASDIDVYDPVGLRGAVGFHIDEQKKFRKLINLGYQDAFRILHPNSQSFSWWDYRGNSWAYNKGMRIDYLLTSPLASDCLKSAFSDDKMMSRNKPSDHCPAVITLDLKK